MAVDDFWQIFLPHPDPHDHLAQVWAQHQDDPQQQAVLSTQYCLAHAPHLAGWLKDRIYASLSDRLLQALLFGDDQADGRLVALCQLAEATAATSHQVPNTRLAASHWIEEVVHFG